MMAFSYFKIKPQFYQKIEIGDKITFIDGPASITASPNEVVKLTYSGTKWIPMSEMMAIETKRETIYVDFNFKNYRQAWKDVIELSREANSSVVIDNKLIKRIP